MFVHIQVGERKYREAMGKLYQSIVDTSVWEKVHAIFHDYNSRRLTLDLAQSDVTDEQEDWLANQGLIEKSWKSWGRDDAEINPFEVAQIAAQALQSAGITTWGVSDLADALLSIKDLADDSMRREK